jgi:hypothetical protein
MVSLSYCRRHLVIRNRIDDQEALVGRGGVGVLELVFDCRKPPARVGLADLKAANSVVISKSGSLPPGADMQLLRFEDLLGTIHASWRILNGIHEWPRPCSPNLASAVGIRCALPDLPRDDVLTNIKPSRLGVDLRTFKCDNCNHTEKLAVQTNAKRWRSSGLRAPS